MSRGPLAIVDSAAVLGGAELSLLPVAERLCAEARVLAFLPGEGPLAERLAALGAEVVPGFEIGGALAAASRQYGGVPAPRAALAAVGQQARLSMAFARLRPSLVYCNGFRAQLAASAPALLTRAALAWHVRDFAAGSAAGLWTLLAPGARLVLANSTAVAGQPALRRLRRLALVVPNGIDLERFRPRSTQPERRTLGMAGHLTPWKGHLRFARLLRAVRERHPDVEGRIAGAPLYDTAGHAAYAGRLADELRNLGLAAACRVEAVEPEAMPHWLGQLTLLVHCPDRPEPFGRVLAEALAVGVPVVSAGGPGADEVVGDAGSLCALGDESALLACVQGLLDDDDARARLAQAGPARAAERFDERVYADRVAAELLSLL